MPTKLMRVTQKPAFAAGPAQDVFIEGLNSGSDSPAVGSVTPASLGGYNADTGNGKVVQVKADGSGFAFVDPATLKGQKGEPGTAGTPGTKGADGKSVKALNLTTSTTGKVTGGTMTLSDDSTVPVTVTTATE